ncbi:hypothetical protein IQ216_07000 [Cyanobium sp. LEGE 06143]|nr:hypothetical protein [Cyanobium sp. LEGE 06143]
MQGPPNGDMARHFCGLWGSLATAALLGPLATAAATATPVSYEIQARTVSGLGAAAAGGGLSAAAVLELIRAEAPASMRSLELTLRSAGPLPSQRSAEHRIPAGLGLGEALPLLPPAATDSRATQPSADDWDASQAQGRLLLYRGCTEDGPTPPVEVIELAQLLPDQRAMAMAMTRLGRLMESANPDWAPGAVVGRWPNSLSSPPLPAPASLVGSHTVRGEAIPEIAFALDPGDDFLQPIAMQAALVAGRWQLSWAPQTGVLGYQAMVAGPGQQEGDLVIWTSNAGELGDGSLLGALAPAALASGFMADEGQLLAPQRTACSLSPQATAQLQTAVLQFSALGEPVQRQAPGVVPAWRLRLERQAVLIQPLLEDIPTLSPAEGARVGPRKPPLFHRGAFNLLRGIF